MSAVFRTLTLTWEGKTYEVKPTMRLLNKIEQQVSLVTLARSLSTSHPQLSLLSYVFAEFLREGGAIVEDEEVYREVMTGDIDNLFAMRDAIFAAVFPAPKKKGETQPDQ